jgi:hypothetical protein
MICKALSTRRALTPGLAFSSVVLLGCSAGALQSSVCKSGVSSAALALTSAERAPSSPPRLLGGLLTVAGAENAKGERVPINGDQFSQLAFKKPLSCSVSLEFRREGGDYFIDAFTSYTCSIVRMHLNGSLPKISVHQRDSTGASYFETLDVDSVELAERDWVLSQLDGLPNITKEVRRVFMNWGVSNERFIEMRKSLMELDPIGPGSQRSLELCVAIPAEELRAYDSTPEGQRGDDPINSPQRPLDCKVLFNSHWHSFKIKPAQVTKSRALLDSLVEQTLDYRSEQSARVGLHGSLTSDAARLRAIEQETYEADRLFRKMNLVHRVLRASGSGCIDEEGQVHPESSFLVGPNRNRYLEIAAQLLPPAQRAEALALRSYACQPTPAFAAFEAGIDRAFYDYNAKLLKLSEEVQKLQATMRANPQYVGIATNHIRNLEGGKVEIAYKDLPLFPASGTLATELSNHIFSYAAPWLSVKYAALQGNRQVTNLRHEYNDGYAITFAGVPVGAVMANIDESGGVAVIPLPRAAEPSTQPKGESAQGTSVDAGEAKDQDAKKTTTNDGKGQSACAL